MASNTKEAQEPVLGSAKSQDETEEIVISLCNLYDLAGRDERIQVNIVPD